MFTFPAITVCNSNILKRSKLNGTRFASLIRADTNALSELEGAVNAMVNTSGSTIMTSEGRHEESKKGEVLIGEGNYIIMAMLAIMMMINMIIDTYWSRVYSEMCC